MPIHLLCTSSAGMERNENMNQSHHTGMLPQSFPSRWDGYENSIELGKGMGSIGIDCVGMGGNWNAQIHFHTALYCHVNTAHTRAHFTPTLLYIRAALGIGTGI